MRRPYCIPGVAKAVSAWAEDALAPPVFCGTLVKIAYDPKKIADASPVYFDNATGDVVAECDNPMASRGKSSDRRVVCPPVEWTCADERGSTPVLMIARCAFFFALHFREP